MCCRRWDPPGDPAVPSLVTAATLRDKRLQSITLQWEWPPSCPAPAFLLYPFPTLGSHGGRSARSGFRPSPLTSHLGPCRCSKAPTRTSSSSTRPLPPPCVGFRWTLEGRRNILLQVGVWLGMGHLRGDWPPRLWRGGSPEPVRLLGGLWAPLPLTIRDVLVRSRLPGPPQQCNSCDLMGKHSKPVSMGDRRSGEHQVVRIFAFYS